MSDLIGLLCHTDDSDVLLVEGQGQYAPPSAKVAGELADDRPRDHVRGPANACANDRFPPVLICLILLATALTKAVNIGVSLRFYKQIVCVF